MGFWDFFRGTQKQKTLADVSVDDLNRERITCQTELNKVEKEREKLQRDEEQLKSEYASATKDFQKKSIARKIQDVRTQQRQVEGWITRVNQNLRVVNNFLMIKKNQAFYERAGVLTLLNEMDVSDIERVINESVVNGTLSNEKLVEVLQAQENGLEQLFPETSDSSLDELMKELDQQTAPLRDANLGEKADQGIEDLEKDLQEKADEGIRLVDKLLNPGE
ncbi:MAG: hypothetical protein Q4C96_07370 [Planctomycetia bacterium]|nr:hypothetical protein [Planctomycetia bacterium]